MKASKAREIANENLLQSLDIDKIRLHNATDRIIELIEKVANSGKYELRINIDLPEFSNPTNKIKEGICVYLEAEYGYKVRTERDLANENIYLIEIQW